METQEKTISVLLSVQGLDKAINDLADELLILEGSLNPVLNLDVTCKENASDVSEKPLTTSSPIRETLNKIIQDVQSIQERVYDLNHRLDL